MEPPVDIPRSQSKLYPSGRIDIDFRERRSTDGEQAENRQRLDFRSASRVRDPCWGTKREGEGELLSKELRRMDERGRVLLFE